jgi:hypothetical protein
MNETKLSPAAQAVLDALIDGCAEASVGPQKRITWWNDRVGLAAALRAAADRVVPDIGYEADCLDEPVESELQCIRNRFLAIAAELEGGND